MTALAQRTDMSDTREQAGATGRKIDRERRRWRPTIGVLNLPFLISIPVLVLIWHVTVTAFDVPSYILPLPADTFRALIAGVFIDPMSPQSLLHHTGITLRGALLGYLIGASFGIIVAVCISESRMLNRIVMPYAIGLQSVPKIALAPLVVIWFGSGFTSLLVLTALVAFFPIFMNTYHGLHAADRDQVRMMKSIGAGRMRILAWVRLPNAAPTIFAGLDVGIVYGLIGALVAEFVSGTEGIGVIILQYQYVNDTAGTFAALFVLGAAGTLLHLAIVRIRALVIFWDKRNRRAGENG